MRKNIVITGVPKSGKSTLLKKLIQGVENKIGFVTHEILGDHGRTGFEIETSNGKKAHLADIHQPSQFRVSKYFVHPDNLEQLLPEIQSFDADSLLYIDEIGQMQLFSEAFKTCVLNYFDAKNICLATLSSVYEDGFIKEIKNREDIILIELTPENRDEREEFIRKILDKLIY